MSQIITGILSKTFCWILKIPIDHFVFLNLPTHVHNTSYTKSHYSDQLRIFEIRVLLNSSIRDLWIGICGFNFPALI